MFSTWTISHVCCLLLDEICCLQALVTLVIEKLERMKASCKQNYDYVVLQATENSIPFYESLGFVRVGGITEDEKYEEKQAKLRGEQVPDSSSSSDSSQSEIVSSPVDIYVTKVAGETPADVANKLHVNVWDIVFLNHYVYPHIGTRSRLMKDTSLYVPVPEDSQPATTQSIAPQWYIAQENDTPRMIARQFHVNCAELVTANRSRLPELQSQSRLKEGTRIKVSHFHIDDDKHVPYCHWTFPDDSFETSEPSYMMVRKLNRVKGVHAARVKPVESSLAVPIVPYTPPPAELFHEVQLSKTTPGASAKKKKTPKRNNKKKHAVEPKKPRRPLNAYMHFCAEQRELLKDEIVGLKGPEVMKTLSKLWKDLPESDKEPYQEEYEEELAQYTKAMVKYEKELAVFQETHPDVDTQDDDNASSNDGKAQTLFNKVVKLNADGVAQTGSEYEYYFVLTFIPDLCWAHLAPLECVGVWGPEKPKAEGRPIWMLVDESEGKEVDISGSCCVPVRSRAMKRTADADCEQWDILDADDATPVSARKIRPRDRRSVSDAAKKSSKGSAKKDGTVKKKRGRPRKHPLPEPGSEKTSSAKKRGRPPKQQHSAATKPLSGSIEPKKKNRGTPKKTPLLDADAGHPSPLTGFVKPKRGRPSKHSLPEPEVEKATTPAASGSVEPKKKGRGLARKHPLPESDAAMPAGKGRARAARQEVSPASDTEEDERPKRRGRQPRKASFSATKPLSGSIEPKNRKRGRLSRSSVKNPSSDSKDEEGSPTKKRKLPRRDVAPAAGSYRDVENSDIDIDDDQILPANRTPTRRKRQSRSTSRELTSDAHPAGNSPFRTVALTRSAEKLSMTSPLMFRPRRGRA